VRGTGTGAHDERHDTVFRSIRSSSLIVTSQGRQFCCYAERFGTRRVSPAVRLSDPRCATTPTLHSRARVIPAAIGSRSGRMSRNCACCTDDPIAGAESAGRHRHEQDFWLHLRNIDTGGRGAMFSHESMTSADGCCAGDTPSRAVQRAARGPLKNEKDSRYRKRC
jgi:hypothetical protein